MLKQKLLNKYQSNFMKNLVNTSPVFNDPTMPLYNHALHPQNTFEERLIEGRMAELDFFESDLRRNYFTYVGDKSIYALNEKDKNFEYERIDFDSIYNVGIDVKIVTVKEITFSDGWAHDECMIRKRDILRYNKQVSFPFVLAYCDCDFFTQDLNTIFIDIKTLLRYHKEHSLINMFKLNNEDFCRINIDYYAQPIKYLYTMDDFSNLMTEISYQYYDYLTMVDGVIEGQTEAVRLQREAEHGIPYQDEPF